MTAVLHSSIESMDGNRGPIAVVQAMRKFEVDGRKVGKHAEVADVVDMLAHHPVKCAEQREEGTGRIEGGTAADHG